ncbi:hypothetical protein J31TS4_14190 [Paenibacillus sp. J31TS4]|uniref:C40 family peptidase n=1 Tax=Paenibacillus sp. J31TS4 TaxID=2807195 RepID=UPI001B18E3D9|nr:C40 family peptidase [Paenibacillus sp. J31TS4]GIP38139.1 hypothetical protein J31TS4_14190 [Paenibacillus sp. J31TS4]
MQTKTNLSKLLLGIGLSTAVLFGGSTAITAQPAHAAQATVSAKATGTSVVNTAKRYMGVPYKWGAKSGITSAFDCSSFVQYVYKKNGVQLPRTVKPQAKHGKFVAKKNLKAGDLVFFYSPMHHVGIYIGNGKFIHTYGKPGVTISDLNSGWWSKYYNTARRIL